MDFSIKKEDVVKALNFTLGVVEKRQTLPILSSQKLFSTKLSLDFTRPCAGGAADLWAAAAAADPSWDRMSGEREIRGRLCEHITRL